MTEKDYEDLNTECWICHNGEAKVKDNDHVTGKY